MSYYNNNHHFFGHRATTPYPHPAHPFLSFAQSNPQRPGHAHAHRHHSPSPAHVPATPAFATAEYDIDEEERLALAHLRQIQHRREAQQASIQREAAARLRAEEEREAAIRRVIDQQRREQAIADAIEQQREAAIERQRQVIAERQRRQAIIEAVQQQRHQAISEAIDRRRNEDHRRQAQIEQAVVERQRQVQAAQQVQSDRFQQALAQRAECAKRCAARYAQRATQSAAKEVKKEYPNELEALNKVLGGLFGINIADTDVKEKEVNDKKVQFEEKEKETKKEEVKEKKDDDKKAEPAQKQSAFPEDVNDLLTQFLGLRIEPASDTAEPATSADNAVPQGLNEFLSRFGLVFEPLDTEKEVAPATSTSTSTSGPATTSAPVIPVVEQSVVADPPEPTLPAPTPASASPSRSHPSGPAAQADDHPLTSFLNSVADLPPFVRDILGNVELAFKEEMHRGDQSKEEEVKGKGKGVAEGEKKERPTPVTAPVATPTPAVAPKSTTTEVPVGPESELDRTAKSLSTLSTISTDLALIRDSFTFPTTLSFAPTSTGSGESALLFNKSNSAYHAQAHALLQLLLKADNISSGGNKDVRRKRKEVVRAVEAEIEGLEKKRDEVWAEVKERRERGEEDVHEDVGSGSTSCSSSTVDPSERHTEDVEHVVDVQESAEKENKEVEGFQVTESTEVVASASSAPTVDNNTTTSTSDSDTSIKLDSINVSATTDSTTETHPGGDKASEQVNVETEVKPEEVKKDDSKAARVESADKEEGYELV